MLKSIRKRLKNWQKKLTQNETYELFDERIGLAKLKLEPVLSGIFGYHALLYSNQAKQLVGEHLNVLNSAVLFERRNQAAQAKQGDLIGQYQQLPIASDSIDLIVLPETLQQSDYPHQILREVERVLIPEGYVILFIANPISWPSIKNRWNHFLIKFRGQDESQIIIKNQWNRKAIGRTKINDWFRLLGLETVSEIAISVTNEKIQQGHYYSWFKSFSTFCSEYLASYYAIVGVKKVSSLTPIRPSWRSNKKLVPSRLAEPSVKAGVDLCVKQIIRE